jgi:glycosyltransferase involved in cell wall biosynthesis
MGRALVSAVIPAHNHGRYVGEAVDSALAQTYSPIEVVVVDDGSTDDTRSRLPPYTKLIRYLHQERGGLSAARNAGIQEAKGEWIALLDADDLWHPEKLELQLRAAARLDGVALVGSPPCSVLPERLPPEPEVQLVGVKDFLTWTPMSPSSSILRRSCLDQVGLFDESLTSVEDRDMWLRVAARFPVAMISSPCWSYRSHPEQMNRDPVRMYDNFVRVLRKFFSAHPEHRGLESLGWAFLHVDACLAFREAGDERRALDHLLRSLKGHPGPLPRGRGKALLRARLFLLLVKERLFPRLAARR